MKIMKNTIENLKKGTAQVLPEDCFEKKLSSKKKLKIKLGMDPTAPDLHLGHVVVLNKLKQLQDLGHEIIFLIGDFTARIGDPTGKSKTRPPLDEKTISENTKTYFEQVGRILDPNKISIRYNSEWLGKLSCKEIVSLCSTVTVARLTERDDFSKRLKEGTPVGMHELLYPIFQGYDSVVLKADIEIGGTDQTFNLLFGRYLQERYNQEPQAIMTLPLLEGLDGKEKMSKSLGNYVGLTEKPQNAYGKLMSISDEHMWKYFHLLLGVTDKEINEMKKSNAHPMELKKKMAHDVISAYWSESDASLAQDYFENIFQKKDYSQAVVVAIDKKASNPIWIVQLLKDLGAVKTTSEAKRLVEAGAVSVDEKKIVGFKDYVSWSSGTSVKVGKHKVYKLS